MSRLAPLALACCACSCAGPSAQAPGPDPDSIRTQASPPLVAGRASRLVGLPVPAHPTVSVRLFFVSGAVDDPPGKEGLTALTATVMAEGGTVKLGAGELSEALYPMAAELSAVTDKETTVFAGRCPKGALERFLPILEDVVREPRFDPGELERLRARAIDAIEKGVRTEDDEELAKQALSLALHRGHPYGHFTGGTVEALRALTLDDVRAHWRRVFVASRLTIGAAGGYEGDLPARIERDLSALPRGSARPPLPAPVTRAPRFLLVEKKTTPTAISMGFTWEVKRGDPDFPALVVAVSALGEHRQGAAFRLFKELRDVRGLNYGDYAYAEHFVQARGSALQAVNHPRSHQQFTVWIRPVEPQHRLFAVRAALREVDRWARSGLSQEELDRVKRFLAGYTLSFDVTDTRRLGYALDDAFYGLARPWLETLRSRLPSLTLDEVNGALRRHVDPARLRVVVVTHGAAELASEIRSGVPSPISYPVPKAAEVLEADRVIERFPLGVTGPEDVKVVKVEELFER
ncbi:MAG TPA: pitrilysin family protein [Anaeromyxobacteraceae bacterium]